MVAQMARKEGRRREGGTLQPVRANGSSKSTSGLRFSAKKGEKGKGEKKNQQPQPPALSITGDSQSNSSKKKKKKRKGEKKKRKKKNALIADQPRSRLEILLPKSTPGGKNRKRQKINKKREGEKKEKKKKEKDDVRLMPPHLNLRPLPDQGWKGKKRRGGKEKKRPDYEILLASHPHPLT